MPLQKKNIQKKEPKVEVKTFNGFVSNISERNTLSICKSKENKTEMYFLAYVEVPRFDKKEGKEEMFAYECGEFLRKKLISGKQVKFEIVTEKSVVPILGGEDIIVSLLELGYAFIINKNAPEKYLAAFEKAKAEKKGMFSEHPEKLVKKRPAEARMTTKELDFFVKKTLNGFIRRIEAPGTYVIETSDRKTVRVSLLGIQQMAPFDEEQKRFKLDNYAQEAVKLAEKMFGMRDCQAQIVENGVRVRAIVTVNGKDVGETMLANGYVSYTLGDSQKELKEKYEAAYKSAIEGKKGRFADEKTVNELKEKQEKHQKQMQDRINNAKVITGKVKYIGKFIKIETEDGKEVSLSFASVKPIYKKDNEAFNKSVEFRMRECIRKQIIGKKLEAKLAYKDKFKGKDETEHEECYYDVYANGKNIVPQLLREGLVKLNNNKDPLKQSFDFDQLKTITGKEFKQIPITEYTAKNIEHVKDYFIQENTFTGVVEKVISVNKYNVYIPSKESTITLNIKNVRIPRGDSEELKRFNDAARNVMIEMMQYQDATITFEEFAKGIMYGDITVKNIGSVSDVLVKKGYAIPTGKGVESDEVEAMRTSKLQIYQFVEETKKEKKEEAPKPKRNMEVRFGNEEKVFFTGFDGSNIFYYTSEAHVKFIEEVAAKLKEVKKGKLDIKVGTGFAVEFKGKWYRAEVLEVASGANVVKCVDTGAVLVTGNGKMKRIPAEIENMTIEKEEDRILSKKLIGIKPLSTKDACYRNMVEAVVPYYNKTASLYVSNDEVKVVVDSVCINILLVEQGLATIERRFNDNGEFGKELNRVQNIARDEHRNAWRFGEIYDEEEK